MHSNIKDKIVAIFYCITLSGVNHTGTEMCLQSVCIYCTYKRQNLATYLIALIQVLIIHEFKIQANIISIRISKDVKGDVFTVQYCIFYGG